jgi:DNA-binding beta-propeller fold protein YncE
LSEIPVTAFVRPPGFELITPSILNAMHYQHPETVIIAIGVFLSLALVAAVVAVGVWWAMVRGEGGANGMLWRRLARAQPRAAAGAIVLLVVILLPGCGAIDPENAPPLNPQMMFGSAGRGLGQFNYPRAMSIDWEREVLFVVDRSSRIQRFSLDGEPQLSWRMPYHEMGFPTGLTAGPDGLLYVADTHYFRVIVFDHDGNEVMRFGEYGTEPGQFIYTTDVAIGPEGRIYVAETGGNDRIQVFDSAGTYLFHFGSFGSDDGQFNRPQSLAFNPEQTELFIADSCNHRIVVTDPEGNVLRTIGRPGRALGEFSYPYGVHVYDDGSFLVVEFHNNRIQKFSADGRARGVWGRVGFRPGELQYPWAAEGDDQRTYVLDSGNNRVQVIRTP